MPYNNVGHFCMILLAFLLGLIVGSFLNVWILRSKTGEDIILKPSHCPKCKHELRTLDLIPIFSFLLLRGKCRYCDEKISKQYFFVELITGIIFSLIYYYFGFTINTLLYCLISAVLVAVFVFDLKYFLISEQMLLAGGFFVLLLHLYNGVDLIQYIRGGIGLALPFFLISFFSGEKYMGYGDSELSLLLGFLVGYPMVYVNFFAAIFTGAIISIILMLFKDKNLKSEVPFGPFLILGTIITLLYGEILLNWFVSFYII